MDEIKQNNIINITEKGNRLFFEDNYTPIVCGNSNYFLKFDFEGDWLKCNHKTAIFVVEGKKFALDFEGDTAKVPALPNAQHFHVALTASYDENTILNTTAIRIRLEPTPLAEDMSEFNPVKSYISKLSGVINKFENGGIKIENAKFAETANNANFATTSQTATKACTADYATVAGSSETQVDLSSDQTVSGLKNFASGIKIEGKEFSPTQLSTQIEDLNNKINELTANLNKVPKYEVVYSKDSPDAAINWGYTSGIQDNTTVSNKDFSKYKQLILFHNIYGTTLNSINDLSMNLIESGDIYQALNCGNISSSDGNNLFFIVGSAVNLQKTSITIRTYYLQPGKSGESANNRYLCYKIIGVY